MDLYAVVEYVNSPNNVTIQIRHVTKDLLYARKKAKQYAKSKYETVREFVEENYVLFGESGEIVDCEFTTENGKNKTVFAVISLPEEEDVDDISDSDHEEYIESESDSQHSCLSESETDDSDSDTSDDL